MKVLQVCPLWYPIKQDAPGGIETLLAQLVSSLSELDCDVTLLASGDSTCGADVLPAVENNIYQQMKNGSIQEYVYYEQQQLQLALDHADDFDIIHSHIGPAGLLLSGIKGCKNKVLHTIHSPIYQDFQWFVRKHPDIWFSTVSQFQAGKLHKHGAQQCHVVHNGIDTGSFSFSQDRGKGLVYLGRIESEKGPDIAINVARELDCPLVLAGPIVQQDYFDEMISPMLSETIQYIGVVNHHKKNILLANASCVLMPSRWDEPFGMVAIEAMACGTPVVVSQQGALPEIVTSGITGYIAAEEEMTEKVKQAFELDRVAVHRAAAEHYDISVVGQKYVELYQSMLAF